MAEWQPNPQELQQLVLLLQKSMSHSTAVQEEVLKKLHEYSNIPDYNSYLVVIFSKYDQNQQEIRLRAGILLKNNIQKHFQSFNPTAQVFIKNLAMQSIGDSYKPIRRIVAAILGSIIKVTDPETWPEFLQILFSLLDNSDRSVVDGSFITLSEITEDFSFQLTTKPLFSQFINNLMAKLIQFYSHPEPEFRNYALKILTKILLCKPDIINPYFSQFLSSSIALSSDSNTEVRKSICSLFITILSSNDIVYQHLQDIYPLFLAFLKDKDESVSLEACEFWVFILEYPDNGQFMQSLFPFVKDLVEILVKNLVYSEEERETLEADEQQQNERIDQQKDIKPQQHQQKSPAEFAGEDHDDGDDIAATGEDDPNAWTLRKCSAKALDYLSGNFADQLLPVFLPALQSVISTPNAPWYVTESAILAIGAVAEGCYNGMTVYLPQLIPFLVQNLTHPNPLMRQISCWAIGRYSDWIVRQPIFPSILEILLKLIIDNSKAVQCASLSSFSEILDTTQVSVLQFIKPILSTFSHALKIYQIRNMLLLYDSIGILCRTNYIIGNDPEIINIFSSTITPQLIEKWKKTENGDIAICTLCNCFTSIALTFGPHFQPFVEPLFTRCLNLIEYYSLLSDQAEYGKSDNDFITFPLELLSGITEGVGPQIEPFVGSTNILSILFHSIKQRYGEIREVSYRLVGDLSRFAIVHMEKGLVPLVEELLKEAPANRNTTLHAVEAVGDLIYYGKDKLNSVAPRVLEWILATLNTPKLKQSIYEVTSVALGKFCIVFPDFAAPLLPNFVDNWCYSMSWLKRPTEREITFKGLCHVITKNPNSIFNQHLNVVFKSIASCDNPSSDLRNMFQQVIDYYKRQSSKEQWNQFVAQLQEFADVLHNNYKIRDI